MRPGLVRLALLALIVVTSTSKSAWGQDTAGSLGRALRDGNFDLALRYRYEFVESDAFLLHANASLLRTRLSYMSAAYRGLSLGLEVDDLRAIVADDFNSTRNGKLDRPIVADPEGTEINQAYLAYTTASGTRIGFGRQRLEIQNRRFIASRNWRLNEQTFDGVTAAHALNERLSLDYAYIWNVNRLFGPDSGTPAADLAGSIHLFDGRYRLDDTTALHGYGYFLDFDDEPSLSSATVGLRFSAEHTLTDTLSLPYSVELARQSDYGDNPIGYGAGYINVRAGLSGSRVRFAAGFERLDGDGTPGHVMTTPLAGLNGMNGWADLFLTIPDDGLEDLTLQLAVPIAHAELRIVAHEYSAATGGTQYGHELNLALDWTLSERYRVLFRVADYTAQSHGSDTTKLWLMLDARF